MSGEGVCECGHTAHWHSNRGEGDCEHDGECSCRAFTLRLFRVTYGWSAFADFSDSKAAVSFAVDMVARPCVDPLQRNVSVLDLQRPAPFPVVWSGSRA